MNKKMWSTMFAVLMIASLVLTACQQATPTSAPATQPPAEQATAAPAEVTAAPAEQATQPPAATNPFDAVDPKGQTIVYWHQQTKQNADALNKLVDEFNKTNEYGITVQAEYQGAYADIFNKMLGVLNTPDAPNLVVAYQNQAATYQLANGLADMTPMVTSTKYGLTADEQKDFFPGFWAQDVFPTYNNARLGFPTNRSMEVLYYNSDWLKELGYTAPPTTPDQFKEMACKAAKTPFSKSVAKDGKSIGYELSIDASRFASWTFAFGGDVYDYNKNQYNLNSDASQKAMAFIQDLFKSGCAQEVTENFGDQTDFGNGKLLFAIGSTSGLGFYQKAMDGGAKAAWSVAAIPHTTPDPVMNIYGASISMPKSTPEKELASWLFLKFLTTPKAQADWATVSGYFPVRASVADSLGDYFAKNAAYKTAFDLLKYGKFEPPVPGYDFVRVNIGKAMSAIDQGADVASTLNTLNDDGNKILKEQEGAPLPTPVPTKPPTPKPAATTAPAATAAVTSTMIVSSTTATTSTVKEGELGSTTNPIIMALAPSATSQKLIAGGGPVAAELTKLTGYSIKVVIPNSYNALVEAMGSGNAHMGWLPPLAYLLAKQKNVADVGLITIRSGADHYGVQFVASASGGFKAYFDPKTNKVTTEDPAVALKQFDGKKACWVDPLSASGYVLPFGILGKLGLKLPDPVFAGSHPAVISSLYNGGTCDFGATFIDARTDKSFADKKDVNDKVVVIWRTGNIIPNDNLSFAANLPKDVRQKLQDALVKLVSTADGRALLKNMGYDIETLKVADDTFYDEFRVYLESSLLDITKLVK